MSEEKVVVASGNRFSPVWILPIVALLLGIWAVVFTITQQGPEIEIRFSSAQGLVAGKTQLKYLSVQVGVIESIRFTPDREAVIATAKLDLEAEDLVREDTRFWVVTARLGAGTISGLDTLLSGAYVALAPGEGAPGTRDFVALELPPVTPPGAPGMHLQLISKYSPSLKPGDAVLYQGYKVGRVETEEFDADSRQIRYRIFIDAPYHELVDSSVRFWNASGISIKVDADGLQVETGSLATILLGGVAFARPEGVRPGQPVAAGTEFKLYRQYDKVLDEPHKYGFYMVSRFAQSLRGLKPGAPVEYRGINIGYVERVMIPEMMALDIGDRSGQPVPVLFYVEPGRLGVGDTAELLRRMRENVEVGVSHGLHAKLATGNLITGSLYIEIDYYPNVPPGEIGSFAGYPTIPSIAGGFGRIEQQINILMETINKLPLSETVGGANLAIEELTATLAALRLVLEDETTQDLSEELQATLIELREVLAGVSPDSSAYQSLNSSLHELNRTLQNLSDFSRTLSAKPNAAVVPVDIPPDRIPEARP